MHPWRLSWEQVEEAWAAAEPHTELLRLADGAIPLVLGLAFINQTGRRGARPWVPSLGCVKGEVGNKRPRDGSIPDIEHIKSIAYERFLVK